MRNWRHNDHTGRGLHLHVLWHDVCPSLVFGGTDVHIGYKCTVFPVPNLGEKNKGHKKGEKKKRKLSVNHACLSAHRLDWKRNWTNVESISQTASPAGRRSTKVQLIPRVAIRYSVPILVEQRRR